MILPDGVRYLRQLPDNSFVVIVEDAPSVRRVRWSVDPGTINFLKRPWFKAREDSRYYYSDFTIALPYTVYLVHFFVKDGNFYIRERAEVYWRNEPLTSLEDILYCPLLMNVSFHLQHCTMCFPVVPSSGLTDAIRSVRAGLYEAGFNTDIGDVYRNLVPQYTALKTIYPIDNWEASTKADPKFILNKEHFIKHSPEVKLRDRIWHYAMEHAAHGQQFRLESIVYNHKYHKQYR
jgi:hypothetical protein